MKDNAFVYILTNKNNTTLYVGMSVDLGTRLWEHRTKQDRTSFSARYNLFKLVYYESFESIVDAINREKFIKRKSRNWKITLVSGMNPAWKELPIPK